MTSRADRSTPKLPICALPAPGWAAIAVTVVNARAMPRLKVNGTRRMAVFRMKWNPGAYLLGLKASPAIGTAASARMRPG
ncbi:hypothetical protein GCM10010080_03320 [Thermomonas carbonis]|nr:hypothetical protein GCM10010080_03320 [Thermomonas carbonis]